MVSTESSISRQGSIRGRCGCFRMAAAGVLLASGAVDAAAQQLTPPVPSAARPLDLHRPVLLETRYLDRLAEVVRQRMQEIEIVVDAPPNAAAAAEYARRYDISRGLAQKIYDVAIAEGVDPELAFRMIRVESRFRSTARGPAGALGLMQLMPSTARAMDRSVDTEAEILDPVVNLRLGFRYLRRMLNRYDDVRLALLAYNRGERAVDRALAQGRDPENGYSRRVLGSRTSRYQGTGRASGR